MVFLPVCAYCDLPTRMIIFYGILNKIVYQPIDKDITSDHRYILTFSDQSYIFSLCERFQILQYLIHQSV